MSIPGPDFEVQSKITEKLAVAPKNKETLNNGELIRSYSLCLVVANMLYLVHLPKGKK